MDCKKFLVYLDESSEDEFMSDIEDECPEKPDLMKNNECFIPLNVEFLGKFLKEKWTNFELRELNKELLREVRASKFCRVEEYQKDFNYVMINYLGGRDEKIMGKEAVIDIIRVFIKHF